MKRLILGLLLGLWASASVALAQSTQPADGASSGWVEADYLLWWVRRGPLNTPLVVTGSQSDPFTGALDQPGTRALFGGNGLGYGTFSGLRASAGAWLDREATLGVEVGGFLLEQKPIRFTAASDPNGQPFLGQPFTNALTGQPNAYFVSQHFADPARDAAITGRVAVTSASRLWGWELNGRAVVSQGEAWRVEALAGLRALRLDEDLQNSEVTRNIVPGGANRFLGTPIPPPFTVTTQDHFHAFNQFYGGQVGARVGYRVEALSFDLLGKVAFGSMHEVVSIDGSTSTDAPLPVRQAPGGIYAQTTNMGRHSTNRFAVVPELNANVGWDLTSWLRARVGYSFLYISSVARPGAQIDRNINTTLVPIDPNYGPGPGPAAPAFPGRSTGFWAQGVNFGLEMTF